MKRIFGGVIVFLVCAMAVGMPTAIAADGSEVYVATATLKGQAAYMVLNPGGTFSDPVDMLLPYPLLTSGDSYGNGIGDFDNDGDLDYITARGRYDNVRRNSTAMSTSSRSWIPSIRLPSLPMSIKKMKNRGGAHGP